MADLFVTNLAGQSEMLTDFNNLTRKRRVNGERSLSFFVMETAANTHAFPLVCEESIVEYDGDQYRIKNVEERTIAQTPVKDVTASHVFFDIVDVYNYEILSPATRSITELLTFALDGTGWTFAVIDSFGSVTIDKDEDFGNDNALALFQKTLELFQAEFELSGTTVRIRTKIGSTPDFQFRYKHNVKTLSRTVNTNDLSTYIKGYGKEREEKDIADTPINYATRTGTWTDIVDMDHYTTQVGATFTGSFTGSGLSLRHFANNQGGIWEVVVDGANKVTVSTWNATGINKTTPMFRGLTQGNHTVVATFKGADPKHAPTGGTARGWVRHGDTDFEKTFDVFRDRVGDELFTCVAEYTSPMSATYGIRHSPPVKSDQITDQAKLLAALQKAIIDKPEVTIELEFIELQNAGFAMTAPGLGDTVPTIYEPLNVDLDLRILEIEDYPESLKSPKVSLSNVRQTYSDVQFSRTKAILDKIYDENSGKLRYNVYTEAVKKATEALNNSMTELEYPEGMGIIARDPENAARFVVFRSAGIGITTDGGATFSEAITADGVTTSLLTAGQINANQISVLGGTEDAYALIDQNGFYVKGGAFSVERPDGYKVVNNGIIQNGFNLQGAYPPFRTAGVTELGPWVYVKTTNRFENIQSYTFKHDSRYLTAKIGMYSDSGINGFMAFDLDTSDGDGSSTVTLATVSRASNDPAWTTYVTMDLGVPDGSRKTLYVRLYGANADWNVYGRILYISQEG